MVAPDRGFELLSVELTGNAADEGVQGVYRAFRTPPGPSSPTPGCVPGSPGDWPTPWTPPTPAPPRRSAARSSWG
ncbi:hypothetical protein ACFQ0M_03580 [Kitasatospora aburaviensis]